MHLMHIPQCTIQNRNVHISVLKWCIVGYRFGALWNLWNSSIRNSGTVIDEISNRISQFHDCWYSCPLRRNTNNAYDIDWMKYACFFLPRKWISSPADGKCYNIKKTWIYDPVSSNGFLEQLVIFTRIARSKSYAHWGENSTVLNVRKFPVLCTCEHNMLNVYI